MAKVSIKQGILKGRQSKTYSGSEYFEFLQIPYAQPPLGNLRFKSPQLPEKWTGERDATTTDAEKISFQFDLINKTTRGGEDCLYLNVYTPRLPSPNHKPLPVMVYIHGGGFIVGTGTIKSEGGPDPLVEKDVVVVSINYRLGFLGFINLGIPEAAGNMGLKDQIMALKWVQENIESFGGDKNNVTIFGISAGGASVEYLILSPLAEGLFHKAIPQSGSPLNHWAINYDIRELTLKVAYESGYQGAADDSRGVYEYFKKQSLEVLGPAASKHMDMTKSKAIFFGFVPSIEKDFGNGETFLSEYPYTLLKQGRFSKVPVMRGFCEYEGLLTLSFKQKELEELKEKSCFLDFWKYSVESMDIDAYNSRFKKAYFENEDLHKEDRAIDFFGDYDFASGVWISSKLMAKQNVPLYEYMFAYDGKLNVIKKMFSITRAGACHGDDTAYVLSSDSAPPENELTETDKLVRLAISTMWTNFAKSGDPTPGTSDKIPIRWPFFTSDLQKYMKIDKELHIKANYAPERMAVFQEIYEKYRK